MAYFVPIPKDSCTFEAILFLILQLEVFLQIEKRFSFKNSNKLAKMYYTEKKYDSKYL